MEQNIPAVVIVGSGPAGLAAAASLAAFSIPSLILERDDCVAPLWRKRTYDCLHLHLPKDLCQLPHSPHPPTTPTFIPRDGFLRYLDDYADRFGLRTLLRREVVSAAFDKRGGRWRVVARNLGSGKEEGYEARYLVVASGEHDAKVVPELPGMEGFGGVVMHSSDYRSGEGFGGKDVLVVGSGNSGMEIALDLCRSGARTSIVVRSEVLPSLRNIKGNNVTFVDGKVHHFDAIILATGYKSTVKKWLKGDDELIGEDGMCKQKYPNHWKGQNGLYCTGLIRKGIYGCSEDALKIAEDINYLLKGGTRRVEKLELEQGCKRKSKKILID